MRAHHRRGDLVHIPQAVELIDCDCPTSNSQLNIPLAVHETQKPEIGVVVAESDGGYLRVFWEGRAWSVKDDRVYDIGGASNG
jgi:hypothetical protein